MKRNGRPSRYNEEIGDKIARFIREGLTIKDACYGVGISDDTFRRWRDKYSEFNKKVIEASNRQWESSEAIAKYHSGYRGYRRPKMCLSPNYDQNMYSNQSEPQKPLREPLKASKPQFWMGLPVRYQSPTKLVPTPKYYNATTNRVEWIEREKYGPKLIFCTCRADTYIRKMQERAWKDEIDSMFAVV